jgi:hypothetical protein
VGKDQSCRSRLGVADAKIGRWFRIGSTLRSIYWERPRFRHLAFELGLEAAIAMNVRMSVVSSTANTCGSPDSGSSRPSQRQRQIVRQR